MKGGWCSPQQPPCSDGAGEETCTTCRLCINHAIAMPRMTHKTSICPNFRHSKDSNSLLVPFSARPAPSHWTQSSAPNRHSHQRQSCHHETNEHSKTTFPRLDSWNTFGRFWLLLPPTLWLLHQESLRRLHPQLPLHFLHRILRLFQSLPAELAIEFDRSNRSPRKDRL